MRIDFHKKNVIAPLALDLDLIRIIKKPPIKNTKMFLALGSSKVNVLVLILFYSQRPIEMN